MKEKVCVEQGSLPVFIRGRKWAWRLVCLFILERQVLVDSPVALQFELKDSRLTDGGNDESAIKNFTC